MSHVTSVSEPTVGSHVGSHTSVYSQEKPSQKQIDTYVLWVYKISFNYCGVVAEARKCEHNLSCEKRWRGRLSTEAPHKTLNELARLAKSLCLCTQWAEWSVFQDANVCVYVCLCVRESAGKQQKGRGSRTQRKSSTNFLSFKSRNSK